jgi:hypothetical protein
MGSKDNENVPNRTGFVSLPIISLQKYKTAYFIFGNKQLWGQYHTSSNKKDFGRCCYRAGSVVLFFRSVFLRFSSWRISPSSRPISPVTALFSSARRNR